MYWRADLSLNTFYKCISSKYDTSFLTETGWSCARRPGVLVRCEGLYRTQGPANQRLPYCAAGVMWRRELMDYVLPPAANCRHASHRYSSSGCWTPLSSSADRSSCHTVCRLVPLHITHRCSQTTFTHVQTLLPTTRWLFHYVIIMTISIFYLFTAHLMMLITHYCRFIVKCV